MREIGRRERALDCFCGYCVRCRHREQLRIFSLLDREADETRGEFYWQKERPAKDDGLDSILARLSSVVSSLSDDVGISL